MNAATATCPRSDELPLLEQDSLTSGQREELELHVEHCPACRTKLQMAAASCCQALPPELLLQPLSPTSTAALAAGDEIAGCQLLKPIGSGAASFVWLALEISTHREIALKLLPANSPRHTELRDRWRSEVAIAARMRHPNLVRLYRVQETPAWFALVFEYVPGDTLAKRLHRELPPPAAAAGILRTLATAVQSMHDQQVLHLDLKPSNILLDYSRGEAWELVIPRISDFGISATLAAYGASPQVPGRLPGCGTPPWTAPEQLLLTPDSLTPAADVHGLGSLLYALLTGQPPLPPIAENKLLETVLHQRPAAPELLVPGLPPQLSRICLRCLEKHPAERYQAASELAAALDDWLAATPGLRGARRPTRPVNIVAPFVFTLGLVVLAMVLLPSRPPNRPVATSSFAPAPMSTATATTATTPAAAPADFLSLLASPAAALDAVSAQRLAAGATQQTHQALAQHSQNSAELLRLGLMLQRAGERMNSSIHAPLYHAAAEIMRNSERLLEQAYRLAPDDQRVLQELVAVRLCLGNLKQPNSDAAGDAMASSLREKAVKLCQCAEVASQMTDQRQQVYWLGQVLDAGRVHCLHLAWSGQGEVAAEIRRQITESIPVSTPAAMSADLRFRMLLWEPSAIGRSISPSNLKADTWIFPNTMRGLQLEAVCNFIAATLFSAPHSRPFSRDAARQCLEESSQLMELLGLPSQLLPQILNSELVRPIAAICSDCRVHNRLEQAERIQQAWLHLC
ncbi:MAG: serine/threonine-protein kinase, partial [Planctomycetaceae bacterium]